MQVLEREAWVYWRTAWNFRLKARAGVDAPEETDDLAVIAQHTEHPVIRHDVTRLLVGGAAPAAKEG